MVVGSIPTLGVELQHFTVMCTVVGPHRVDVLVDIVSEWLRRLPRKQLGSACAGSSPVNVDVFLAQIRYSVGGYHMSLSRSRLGFESRYRKWSV